VEADAERGAKVFKRACADCHGADGKGTDPDERPGGINNPALLTLISNQALRRIVITGRHDLGMPNFAGDDGRSLDFQPLKPDEIADVVALMATWRDRGSSAAVEGAGK
jgi:cytochrome c oxidase cbb3-type subunit 3/ubiquinol-cytochrome c reductase cytochrome c subunit